MNAEANKSLDRESGPVLGMPAARAAVLEGAGRGVGEIVTGRSPLALA
jgi:hypothetical protein